MDKLIELDIALDPWLKDPKNRQPMPEAARLVCTHELHLGIDAVPQLLAIRRTETHDELWGAYYPDRRDLHLPYPGVLDRLDKQGRVASAPRAGDPKASARRLFKALVRCMAGHAKPLDWLQGDLIGKVTFNRALEQVEQGIARNAEVTARYVSPSVETAQRLGLHPEPLGTVRNAWEARCPGTHHRLVLSSATDTFGCGYCRRKGGIEALEAFVVQRRKKVEAPDSGLCGASGLAAAFAEESSAQWVTAIPPSRPNARRSKRPRIPKKTATISVEWGYEMHSITLTARNWTRVKNGNPLGIRGNGYYYEGEFFWDYWDCSGGLDGRLVVGYGNDGGQGFSGRLRNACIEEHDVDKQVGQTHD